MKRQIQDNRITDGADPRRDMSSEGFRDKIGHPSGWMDAVDLPYQCEAEDRFTSELQMDYNHPVNIWVCQNGWSWTSLNTGRK